ncbi:MAG: bifunctional sulfate adenylyltransferase/adenylylsulfate kinase [Pseudomonadota bacterium]|nr:bifunctional sulfate adenylyltransferase/adenylylsulfate kinase [Pseudomonadota bacterium]
MLGTSAPVEGGFAVSDLLVDEESAEELRKASLSYPSLTLTKRQLCDVELLINGGFSPLRGFMDRATYDSVVEGCRLPDGSLWPMPVVLDVDTAFAGKLEPGQKIALRDPEGFMPAALRVKEVWQADKGREADQVYGIASPGHPGVRYLMERVKSHYVAGRLEGIQLPAHHEFENLWDTPEELRHLFRKMGWRRVIAFHSTDAMHKLHRQLIIEAAKRYQAHVLIHPAVGETKPGDLHHYARVHCYKAIQRHLPHGMTALSLLPLAMRMAGPREALWHAIINRNFGCTHFLIGPDHASPPRNGGEEPYAKYEAQEFVKGFADEIGIEIIEQPEYRYVPTRRTFLPDTEILSGALESLAIGKGELKTLLIQNREIPEWFSYPEVLEQLRKVCPPHSRQGITLFFTGLSGSGKSTLANIIFAKLIEAGGRPVSLLDGDIVRQNLSSELGFSKAHRDLNIRRIGFVASEITKNGGVAICAPIAPYRETRRAVRDLIEQHGAFIEVHVSTPLEVCEARDRKGLYAKARKGIIPEFTGISDPYEVPARPELSIDTSVLSPTEAAQEVLLYLLKEGYLDEEG